eukprot:m51a1_g3344 hypothetical protein (173) ;mRNA; r:401457-402267
MSASVVPAVNSPHPRNLVLNSLPHVTGLSSGDALFCQWSCRPTGSARCDDASCIRTGQYTNVRWELQKAAKEAKCAPADDGLFCYPGVGHDNYYLECRPGMQSGWRKCAVGTQCTVAGKHDQNPCRRLGDNSTPDFNGTPSDDNHIVDPPKGTGIRVAVAACLAVVMAALLR